MICLLVADDQEFVGTEVDHLLERALLATTADVGEVRADADGEHVVAIMSTVLPDVIEEEVRPRLLAASGRNAGDGVHLAVNPDAFGRARRWRISR